MAVDDAVGDRLAGQILAGPVGDVQALGDRLQAGQFDDLGALEGGNLLRTAEAGFVQQESLQAALLVAATDAPDGGPVTLQPGGDRLDRFPGGNGQDDAGMLDLEPRPDAGCGPRLARSGDQRQRWSGDEVFGHAWDTSDAGAGPISSIPLPRICCITSYQAH